MTLTSRFGNPAADLPQLGVIAAAVNKVNDGVIPQTTVTLMGLRVGQMMGSSYLTARINADAQDTPERLGAVATWRDSPLFTDAEKAALALAEAVHTPNPGGPRVSDEVYAEAAKHYSEKELVVLTGALGQIGFFIPLALIGQPIPGVSPQEQWKN